MVGVNKPFESATLPRGWFSERPTCFSTTSAASGSTEASCDSHCMYLLLGFLPLSPSYKKQGHFAQCRARFAQVVYRTPAWLWEYGIVVGVQRHFFRDRFRVPLVNEPTRQRSTSPTRRHACDEQHRTIGGEVSLGTWNGVVLVSRDTFIGIPSSPLPFALFADPPGISGSLPTRDVLIL